MVHLGDIFPDFAANTSDGPFDSFHEWIGDSWAMLFSHPADYTPVCTSELAKVVTLETEFKKRNVKLIALSCDDADNHKEWGKDVIEYSGCKMEKLPYPIIADDKRELVVSLGMIDPNEKTKEGLPLAARSVFIIGPDKRLKLSILYPATTGRNFVEILRAIDSLQLTATKKVATPVDWQHGDKCMVLPTLSNEEALQLFPNLEIHPLPSGKEYLRLTPQP